jgi:hypothetical protein
MRSCLGNNPDQRSCEERQAVAHGLLRKVVATAEQVDTHDVLP